MQPLCNILLVLGGMLLLLLLQVGDAAGAAIAEQQSGRAVASVDIAAKFRGHRHVDGGWLVWLLLLAVQTGGLLERHHRYGRWRLTATQQTRGRGRA